ncbi:MAG: rhodanese-like domain-containing protein, partial [Planctomycetes bacterium]|nr:rhodanese-like domain-containing protein [Planctomycetota bacterium]
MARLFFGIHFCVKSGWRILGPSVIVLMVCSVGWGHVNVSAQDANDMMLTVEGLIVVDVRGVDEYCGGHIPGAINLVWTGVTLPGYKQLPVDGKILLICRSGYRSNLAALFLDAKGYTHVYDMVGGMNGWSCGGTVGCVDSDGDGV